MRSSTSRATIKTKVALQGHTLTAINETRKAAALAIECGDRVIGNAGNTAGAGIASRLKLRAESVQGKSVLVLAKK